MNSTFDWTPLIISLQTAVFATAIVTLLGFVLCYTAMYLPKGKLWLDAVITLPLVLPPTVIGFLLLVLLGRQFGIGRLFQQYGVQILFTQTAAILAAVVVSLPLFYRTTRSAFDQLDTTLIHVAQTLGKHRLWILWHVIIPETWPGIAAGMALAFARALGEFGATMMVAGNIPGKTRSMSLEIYAAVGANNYPLAWRWVVVIMLFSFLCFLLLQLILAGAAHRRKNP